MQSCLGWKRLCMRLCLLYVVYIQRFVSFCFNLFYLFVVMCCSLSGYVLFVF